MYMYVYFFNFQGEVIKAWDMGVATMRRGEIAVITCKPEYAYGKSSKWDWNVPNFICGSMY